MWKLYYHDRTTFSSEDGDWVDAPAWGVMAVAHSDENVGYTRDTGDFYIKPDYEPWAADHWGVMDYLLHHGVLDRDERMTDLTPRQLENAGVKMGRSVPNDEWQEVLAWINDDREEVKSARYRHERP